MQVEDDLEFYMIQEPHFETNKHHTFVQTGAH